MSIAEVLSGLRREKGFTQPDVASYLSAHGCSVTNKAVSKWEQGATMPDAEQFILLCELYGVRDVLKVFRKKADVLDKLNSYGHRRLEEYARLLALSDEFLREPINRQSRATRALPLYDLPVSAGTGLFLDSSHYELIDVEDTVPIDATFAVRVRGDSMTPKYVDQQIVYVKQQQSLEDGDYGIFLLNGDAYCKKFRSGPDVQLLSLNKRYAPITITENDELRVVGKVVG